MKIQIYYLPSKLPSFAVSRSLNGRVVNDKAKASWALAGGFLELAAPLCLESPSQERERAGVGPEGNS